MAGTKLIALLRGINLGSNKRVGMADLRKFMAELDYPDAVTHLQSGNLVFTGTGGADATARRLTTEISNRFGFTVSVVVRTRAELAKVVSGNPMEAHTGEPAKLMVVFLGGKPDRGRLGKVDPAEYAPDEFAVKGREIYVWLPNGMQKSKLGNEFWEKATGTTATTRNWNTVTKLLELAS